MIKSYSSGDVAKICDVTPRTIIRWISSGKLSAFKLPGRGNNRISHEALFDFLRANAMPIPKQLAANNERHCVIIGSDKHLVRHVKRIVRDADYMTHVIADPIEAGLSIASNQPLLVVLDGQALSENAEQTARKIYSAMSPSATVILFTDNENNSTSENIKNGIWRFKKPLNLSVFASHIEQLC